MKQKLKRGSPINQSTNKDYDHHDQLNYEPSSLHNNDNDDGGVAPPNNLGEITNKALAP